MLYSFYPFPVLYIILGIAFVLLVISSYKIQKERNLHQRERDFLIRAQELHHRVKNDLQLVSSMLHMQARETNNTEVQLALQASCNRLETIGKLYHKLSFFPSGFSINAREYLQDLVQLIHPSTMPSLTIHLDIQELVLDNKTVAPIAHIVNELVTNTLKHVVCTHTVNPRIEICLYELDNCYEFRFSNNGPALPVEAHTGELSLGFRLIRSFSKQLNAKLNITNSPYPVFTFTIPKAHRNDCYDQQLSPPLFIYHPVKILNIRFQHWVKNMIS